MRLSVKAHCADVVALSHLYTFMQREKQEGGKLRLDCECSLVTTRNVSNNREIPHFNRSNPLRGQPHNGGMLQDKHTTALDSACAQAQSLLRKLSPTSKGCTTL